MKIHKGDTVIIIAGKDKGKTGKVVRSLPIKNKVIVEGVNIVKKHQKAKTTNQKGGVIDKTMPINVSNVMLVHPKTKKGVRIGYKIENHKKIRITKGGGEEVKI